MANVRCIKDNTEVIVNTYVGPAETGTYYFKKRIDCICKNADDILVFYLTQYFKEHPGHRIELVDVTVSIDRGKGFSWDTLVVIVHWK